MLFFYIITLIIHAFLLVLAYELLEDRREDDVTVNNKLVFVCLFVFSFFLCQINKEITRRRDFVQ